MSTDFSIALRAELKHHNVLVGQLQFDQMVKHYELLVKWNRTHNLTRITAPEQAARDHYTDCLLALNTANLDGWPTLTDVGSGAGFPGIIAAIMSPTRPVTLIEKVSKKASFLREAVRCMRLKNVTVESRALGEDDRVDYVCSRATFPLEHPLFHHLMCSSHALFMVAAEPDEDYWKALCARYGRTGERREYKLAGAQHRAVLTVEE